MRFPVLLVFSCAALPAQAEYKFGFADVSYNFLDWSQGTEDKSTKRDFSYLELEGYAQYDWGDLYGFFDYENPGHKGDEVRTAFKGAMLRKILGGLSIYAGVYNFAAHGFYEQSRVLGLGYFLEGKGWWFKPWIGFHDVSQRFFSGPNGYILGWTVGYNFEVLSEKFMIADWHEFEFDRKKAYAAGNGGNQAAHNGALSVWWNLRDNMSAGIQGRYATDKLGTPGSLGAIIYTVKLFL